MAQVVGTTSSTIGCQQKLVTSDWFSVAWPHLQADRYGPQERSDHSGTRQNRQRHQHAGRHGSLSVRGDGKFGDECRQQEKSAADDTSDEGLGIGLHPSWIDDGDDSSDGDKTDDQTHDEPLDS